MEKEKLLELINFSKTLKILYVEDNQEARYSTISLLKMFFDDITIAVDGQEGLEKYNNNKFDLIITDINMPNMNGLEMVSHIRKVDENIAIIILTAFEESTYLLESIQYSVDNYLLKPIQTEQFIQIISKSLYKIQLEYENHQYKENLENIIEEQKEKIHKHEKYIYQQAKLASMGEMIDSVAHQWKQPLSTIYSYVQNLVIHQELIGQVTLESLKECNDNVKYQIDHLIGTMDEFRNFFRPDVQPESILLKEIVNSVIILVKNDLQNNNIKITTNCDCDIKVNIIPNEFKHILINIINNAKDAFKENIINKTISIHPDRDDNYYMLKIQDNAGGIPENVIEHIFEGNFTTKENSGGTGMGLYMSKMIIEKINGKLEVYNDKDGAVFILKIPK